MNTIPNLISLLRFPLALLFIPDNPTSRLVTILMIALTDFLDGFLARRLGQKSRIGTIIDPIADKFFVMVALSLFYSEGRISLIEISALLCRDFSVILFGIYLIYTRNFGKYHFRAIWCGKITTALQLTTLGVLTWHLAIPTYLYSFFVVLGLAALIELYLSDHSFIPSELRNRLKET